jgi:3-hydroxyisobutyrate dehydrogenase
VTVKDDASVNEVLAAAEAALKPGATIIDHTTTSVEGAVQRTKTWKEKGFTYLHAPVFMGPKNALESTGFMLVSGDQQVISKWQDQLSSMTGKLLNFGPTEGKAAGMKLIGNLFLISLTAGLSDVLKLAKSVNINGDEINSLFTQWNPGAMVQQRLKTILASDFSHPSWELNMARKDAGLMMKEAENANEELTVIPAVAALMDEWIKNGHGNDDWMIIAS